MASLDFREISKIALSRREASLPSEFLLPKEKLAKLPKDLTSIPRSSGHFTHDEIEIVESNAESILQKISEKIWTAVEVTEAFCKAATVAQQLTNCVTEILFTEAVAQAKQLDEYLARTGSIIGPLHGLPISLKDNMITPPHPSSVGLSYYANNPTSQEDETLIVSIIKSLGAVAYVKTNIPVAMMMMETQNNVWGETVNPHHPGCSSGGSSGGEGALISMRGSPLGIGTDVGGSIRIPSAFCGLYGLKPSYGRYPQLGARSGIPGQEFVLSVNGPMSRHLETLQLYSAAILSGAPAASPWTKDPKCLPIPWRIGPQILPPGRKLRLGFFGPSDGVVTVHPPIERALKMTREACQAAGHEIIEWPVPPDYIDMEKTLLAAFYDFGGPAILPLLQEVGEPVFPSMQSYAKAGAVAQSSPSGTGLGPDRMREMNMVRNKLMKSHLDRWYSTAIPGQAKAQIDGLIMPASPWTACRRNVTNDKTGYIGFTGWVNLLDLCSCTFPVTTAAGTAGGDGKRAGFKPLSDIDATVQGDYDPDFYEGSPVSLQLVGERLGEEKVLEAVAIVRDALNARDGGRR